MSKTFVGPQLRQLRRQNKHTQAQMAQRLGISAAYVNLLENNQRSLSVQVLVALTDAMASRGVIDGFGGIDLIRG